MPESHYLLAVDQGTTSVKAYAFLPSGEISFSAQCFISTYRPQPGFAEQNPQEIFAAVWKVIHDVLNGASGTCAGISFSCAMHGIMAVDEQGTPLTNLLIWSDTRSKGEAAELRHSREGRAIYSETGTPIHPMSPLCKIKWLHRHQADLPAGIRWASFKDFFLWRVTGCFILDHSLASASGLFNRNTFTWSSRALDWCNIRPDQLPQLVSVRHIVNVDENPAWSRAAGLPVVVGASDGCLAQMGGDAMAEGVFTITLGTSIAVRAVNPAAVFPPDSKLFHYLLNERTMISGAASNNGTAVIDWWNENHSLRQSLEEFVEHAVSASAGCEGLIFRPYVFGERAPFYDPELQPAFIGMNHHSLANQQRAILEGICFVVRHLVETVEAERSKASVLRVSGGAVRSAHWMQMLCNILDRSIEVDHNPDASARGAALLGWAALGEQGRFMSSETTTYQPDGKFDYSAHYHRFIHHPID
jgi:gluconokinase